MTLPPDQPIAVEVSLFGVRRHGRHLLLPVLALIAISAATGFWVGTLPEAWMNWTAGIGAILLGILLGIGPILDWLTTRTSVTTRRVIQRHGLFVHQRSEIPLHRVRGVRSVRGPIQRLFGSGDVELLVGAEDPVVLRDVPSCLAVVDALQELIETNFALHGAQPGQGATPQTGAPGTAGAPQLGHPDETRVLPGFPPR